MLACQATPGSSSPLVSGEHHGHNGNGATTLQGSGAGVDRGTGGEDVVEEEGPLRRDGTWLEHVSQSGVDSPFSAPKFFLFLRMSTFKGPGHREPTSFENPGDILDLVPTSCPQFTGARGNWHDDPVGPFFLYGFRK